MGQKPSKNSEKQHFPWDKKNGIANPDQFN
jgi:hypothetical protein